MNTTQIDYSHLHALESSEFYRKQMLAQAKTQQEKYYWTSQIESVQKEIKGELDFLGLNRKPLEEISDTDMLAELGL